MEVINLAVKIPKSQVPTNQIIRTNTIFTVKRDDTHKARIVCREDLQDSSSSNEIDTSVLNMNSLKLLLIIANNKKMYLRTFDINHAFLYAPIDTKLYITHLEDQRYVTPLKKALYGLKQSPKRWNDTLKHYMNSIGLYDSIYSPGLFISSDGNVMIAAYVDDCIIAASSDKLINEYISKMKEKFSLKEIDLMRNNILDTDILGIDLICKKKMKVFYNSK